MCYLSRMNRLILTASGIIVLSIFSLAPFWKVVVVPEWPVRVVDKNNLPFPGVRVRQHWHHYSFDGSGTSSDYGGEEDLISNQDGMIVFPKRSFNVSLVGIAVANIGTPLRWINPHSSSGPSSFLICLSAGCGHSEPGYNGKLEQLHGASITVESDE